MYDGSEHAYFGGATAAERCRDIAERVRELLGVGPAAYPAGGPAGDAAAGGLNPGLQGYLQTPASDGTPEDPDSGLDVDPPAAVDESVSIPPAAGDPPPAKPPVSERKLAANRANAAKSTGPRSAVGKAKSKLNAVTHGIWAATALLDGESADELADLAAEFDADHGAGSAAERALAGRAVSIVWRLRRLARAEEALAAEAAGRMARARGRFSGDGGGGGAAEDWPDGAQVLAGDFVAASPAAGRLQQLMAAEGRLSGQLTGVCRLLLKARAAA